jgi:enoyl-CoA hydratase
MTAPDGRGRAWNSYDAQFAVNPGKALRAMSKPVIAAVNGACVSGGLEIALSCSFIVASERARFADTHARLGVVATWGLTALLPRAVGIRKAREMSATGNFVAADEALRLGLVNHVVAHDELLSFARTLAGQVPDLASIAETLLLYERGQTLSLHEALALETQHTIRRSFDADSFGVRGRDTAARNQQS